MPDYRSPEATEYRRLYKTKAWQQLRKACLIRDNFTCRFCKKTDWNTSRLVADHIKPHRGDEALFFDIDNLMTLCAEPCHNRHKQEQERSGVIRGSIDGRPRDPNHPWNRAPGAG